MYGYFLPRHMGIRFCGPEDWHGLRRTVYVQRRSVCFRKSRSFSAFGGWLILNETINSRSLIGCTLMLSGMRLSQLYGLLEDVSFASLKGVFERK